MSEAPRCFFGVLLREERTMLRGHTAKSPMSVISFFVSCTNKYYVISPEPH